MPPAYYPPPARKSSLPVILVVLVVIVVIAVVLVGVGVLFVFYERTAGNVDMSVSGTEPYTANYTSDRPGEGREWIVVNVTLTNNRSYDLPIVWAFFTVSSGGETNSVAVFALEGFYHPPATVPPGQSRSFPIVFDVPAGSHPTVLHYNSYIAEATCPIP